MIEQKIKSNVPLDVYTTFKIGGLARYFVEVVTKDDLVAALDWAGEQKLAYFILGGGSNLLISDRGYDGLVIQMLNRDLSVDNCYISAGAGLELSGLVSESIARSLAGLVWASGIPGTLGGAVRGNAGAYGGEVKDNLCEVEYYDTETRQFMKIGLEECAFAYRSSGFKSRPERIIWQAKFLLAPADKQALEAESLSIIKQRQAKLPPEPSAGSVFKNLLLEQIKQPSEALLALIAVTEIKGAKLAAGTLIDQLDLKGRQIGGASISLKHGNVIINNKKAKASEVLELIKLIKDKSKQKFDLNLEEEISCIGF